jgi:hypothetical protein
MGNPWVHGYPLTNVKHGTSERRTEHRASPHARAAECIHGHRHQTDRNHGRAPIEVLEGELVWLLELPGQLTPKWLHAAPAVQAGRRR